MTNTDVIIDIPAVEAPTEVTATPARRKGPARSKPSRGGGKSNRAAKVKAKQAGTTARGAGVDIAALIKQQQASTPRIKIDENAGRKAGNGLTRGDKKALTAKGQSRLVYDSRNNYKPKNPRYPNMPPVRAPYVSEKRAEEEQTRAVLREEFVFPAPTSARQARKVHKLLKRVKKHDLASAIENTMTEVEVES